MNRTQNNIGAIGLLACTCFVAAPGLVQRASAETATMTREELIAKVAELEKENARLKGEATAKTATPKTATAEHKAVDTSREFKQTGEVKSAVRTGNDPRDFGHKITPYYRHDQRRGGIETDDAMLSFMVPFTFPGTQVPSAFTFESPLYRWQDIDGVGSESGIADWTMRLILKPWITDFPFDTKASHVFFLETTMPTGKEGLTSDQTILSPGYGPIISNSPNWFFAPLFFYDTAIDNKSPAESVNRLRSRIFYQYAWNNGVYVLPEAQLIYDFNEDAFTANLLPEIGWVYKKPPKLTNSYRPSAPPGGAIYVKGGPGISNGDAGDLDWRIEIGHRFLW